MNERIGKIRKMYNSYNFDNNIYLIGFGAIGRPLLYMLLKIINIDPKKITVIDKQNKKEEITNFLQKGVIYINKHITHLNYKDIFDNVNKNDIIIDCAYSISTNDMILLCQEKECNYVNSSLEEWDYLNTSTDPILNSTLSKHKVLFETNNKIKNKKFNAIISMGCNPGNVSIWTKLGLEKINKEYEYEFSSHADLAQKLGVQVIHISERDTQINNNPKKVNEYCNTWSSDGEAYFDESLSPVELSYGTHEKNEFKDKEVITLNNTNTYDENYLILNKIAINTFAQSVVPIYGRFIGNIIRHEETFTIGKTLEIRNNKNKLLYKPSIYYVYHPCDNAKISLNELKEREYKYQTNWRLLTHEITSGNDLLGLTYFLENKKVYWYGSLLNITEAREIFNNEFNEWINATIVQVMAGFLGSVLYTMELITKKQYNGLMTPDDLPYKKIFNITEPFFGDFCFEEIKDFKIIKFDKNVKMNNTYTNDWQLKNFMI